MKLELHIKHHRISKHLSQQKLAEITGLTQQYVSRLESDTDSENPTFSTISLIAQALDICPYSIFSIHCDPCRNKNKHCAEAE